MVACVFIIWMYGPYDSSKLGNTGRGGVVAGQNPEPPMQFLFG